MEPAARRSPLALGDRAREKRDMGSQFSMRRVFPLASCRVWGIIALSSQASFAQPKPDSSDPLAELPPDDAGEAVLESHPSRSFDQNNSPPRDPSPTAVDVSVEVHLEEDSRRRDASREGNNATGFEGRADVLALTVSGGVSLGSYEAGELHLLTEALRRSPGSAKLKVVTGASAGSANAIIAGTDACQKQIEDPEQSLGYRVWVESGLRQLFDPRRVSSSGLFVRDGLRSGFDKIEAVWQKGLPQQCDFVFGVAVTREEGYEVDLA